MIAADLLKLGWNETLEPQTKQELAIHHPMPYRYTIETKNYVIKKTVYSSSHLTPSFDVTAGTVRLWGKDLGIVIKAYDQASSLMKEKRAAEMLATEQNKAIDVIERSEENTTDLQSLMRIS